MERNNAIKNRKFISSARSNLKFNRNEGRKMLLIQYLKGFERNHFPIRTLFSSVLVLYSFYPSHSNLEFHG